MSKGHEPDLETNLEHTNASTVYTRKRLEADPAVLREIVPGWRGQDEDGTFRVVVEDRGADYPYRYTLLMAWDDSHGNEGCGQVSHSIPGWPHGWPGRYFRTPRELRGAMHSAAYDASWVMEVRS